MGYYHQFEEFPQRNVGYLQGRPNSEGIKIRILSSERIMLTQINVTGGGTIPRHYHGAEQIIILQKGEAKVTTGDDKTAKIIKPGDIWIVPANTMHGIEYLGNVEAIEIVNPPRLDNFIGYTMKLTFFENEGKQK